MSLRGFFGPSHASLLAVIKLVFWSPFSHCRSQNDERVWGGDRDTSTSRDFWEPFCLFVLLRSLLVLAVINQLFKRFAWNYIHTHLILHHIYEFFVVDHAISIHVYTLQKLLDLVLSQGEVVAGKTLTKLFRADWAAVILVEIGESRSQMALFQVVVTREASCYELGVVNEPVLIRVYRAHGVQNITFW